jgi:hypothetical protein
LVLGLSFGTAAPCHPQGASAPVGILDCLAK